MARPSLLSVDQIESELSGLPGWCVEGVTDQTGGSGRQSDDGRAAIPTEGSTLVREFQFKNFTVAFGFMASVATVAERMGHHPDWSNSYNRVMVRLSTHDAGGVTSLDVELAHAMSDLAETPESS